MPSVATISASAPAGCARARFAPAHEDTVFVLPGDCFAAEAYGPLADRLFERGANAFVIDYVAAAGVAEESISHDDCVAAVTRTVYQIREAYGLPPGRQEYLMGHSRGAYVAIGTLPQLRVRRLLLHAPYLGPAYAGRPPLALAVEVGSKVLRRRPVRLSFSTFKRRFFGDGTPDDDARAQYERSREIPRGLLRDRSQFDLSVLRDCEVAVWVYAGDCAIPAANTLRTIAALSRAFDLRVRVTVLPGPHTEVIVRPDRCAEVANRCLA